MSDQIKNLSASAFRFVIILGIADFFADATYEGGRSILGPYLGSLGASGTIIGLATGFGEMVGYVLRAGSGLWLNKTHRYWLFAIAGYSLNMLSVPLLAVANTWQLACAMVVAERAGRAIRKPAAETMLSYTADTIGRGWVFGLNTALDQAGATLGPLLVSLLIFYHYGYKDVFASLLIPGMCCIAVIVFASIRYPKPEQFAKAHPEETTAGALSKAFWLYVAAGALIAAGFADFALVTFHIHKSGLLAPDTIPMLYAFVMATGAITSLVLGKLLDSIGFKVFFFAVVLSSAFAPLIFSNNISLIILGSGLWGLGKGAQDSIFKAELVRLVPLGQRSKGFGTYSTAFGIGWFAGSALMGWLYDHSIQALIIFSVIAQLLSIPFLIAADKSVD